MNNRKLLGFTLATAAAVVFSGAPMAVAFADTTATTCYGANACKGQSDCQTLKNSCSGENSCKGQGILVLPPEDCFTAGGSQTPPAPSSL